MKQSNLLQIYTNSESTSQVAEKFPTERDLKTMWNVARQTLLGNKWTFEWYEQLWNTKFSSYITYFMHVVKWPSIF